MIDFLCKMWEQQEDFMNVLRKKRIFPEFPIDLDTKEGQKNVKSIIHDCMHELFEAAHLLKNSKDHRATNINNFDKKAFVIELADTLHYLFEICIMSGITMTEIYDAYMHKGEVNIERINNGY